MSWGSLLINLVSAAIVLPVALLALTPVEAALWLLLILIGSLAVMVSFGLQATFARLIAYAMGGASVDQFDDSAKMKEQRGAEPDPEALRRVVAVLCGVGGLLTGLSTLLFGVGGAVASAGFILAMERPEEGWIALSITVGASVLAVWGQIHIAYLMGINRVLSLRRWELISSVGSVSSMLAVILIGGGFVGLVAVTNFWTVFKVARNAYLARRYDVRGGFRTARPGFDREVLSAAWPAQWRLGVAVGCTFGLVQLSGVAAAQLGSPGDVASYLFHLRLISVVNGIALPPFYNRIPQLSQFMAGHRFDPLRDLARRRMALAYWSFAASFLVIGLLGQWFIDTIAPAEYQFSPALWAAFGLAFYMERVTGMHGQLYMLTNRVMYMLNVAAGAIYLGLAIALVGSLGMIAFPLAYFSGLSIAFAPVIMTLTYRFFTLPFPAFELRTSAPPSLVLLAYAAASFFA